MSEPTPETILHQTDVEEVINKEIDEAKVEENITAKTIVATGIAHGTPGTAVTVDFTGPIPEDLSDAAFLAFVRHNHRVVQTSGAAAASFHITAADFSDESINVICTVASLTFDVV